MNFKHLLKLARAEAGIEMQRRYPRCLSKMEYTAENYPRERNAITLVKYLEYISGEQVDEAYELLKSVRGS